MTNNFLKNKSGFTLIETIFYLALLAIFSVLIINILMVMTRSFRITTVSGDIVKASSIMERISREIKQAESINSISANSLTLNTVNNDSEDIALEFELTGTNINILEDSISLGNLNSPNISVSNLTFTQITTTAGVAVRVYLALSSTRDEEAKVYEFYDTLVLRGDY